MSQIHPMYTLDNLLNDATEVPASHVSGVVDKTTCTVRAFHERKTFLIFDVVQTATTHGIAFVTSNFRTKTGGSPPPYKDPPEVVGRTHETMEDAVQHFKHLSPLSDREQVFSLQVYLECFGSDLHLLPGRGGFPWEICANNILSSGRVIIQGAICLGC